MLQTVKQKIRWGTLFLFLLLLLLGGTGIFYIVRLKNDSGIILRNNYESLDYCHQMQKALDSVSQYPPAYLQQFDGALDLQEKNITETAEISPSKKIRALFEKLRTGDHSPTLPNEIRANLQIVINANMVAIESKSNRASATAERALTYITLIATIIFLIGLSFSYNFPSIVTGPIEAFTTGIKEIATKKYHHRIHLDRKDEFGQMADAFNAMATRLEYFESSNLNQIIFEKTRAEAVINSMKDASIGIDGNGRVLFANDQALQLIGMKTEEIVSKPLEDIAARNDLFRFLLEEKGTAPFSVVVNNRENYFMKEVLEIPNTDNYAKVIVLKNITSFKEIDAAKTNLIATISHELKTPLAASDLSIKLLEDQRTGELNKEQQEFVTSLKQDNQRMLKILSELLNMAQIEAGKIQLDVHIVSPYAIVDKAIDSVMSQARERAITITRNFQENLPEILADPDKTAWVLNNFLNNAVKYSPNGSSVSMNLMQIDNFIEFSVSDMGPGIPKEYQSKVFNRFFRVPGTQSAGNGLGLSISKEFIDAQEGTIWVRSEPGEGSTFGFSLRQAK